MFDIVNHYQSPTIPEAPSFLDLSGALAAAGFIGAIYHFKTPLWALVLRIRSSWQRNLVWMLIGFGLFIMFLRVLFFGNQLIEEYNVLTNPMNYELTAYLFFIIAPLSFLWFGHRSKIFSKTNYNHFNSEIIKEIAKGTKENTQAAFELLMINFEDICIAIKSTEEEISQSTRSMINIALSDDDIVEILTTKTLDKLIGLFELIEKHKINSDDLPVCLPKIIQNLLLEQQSFFYKHLEINGLAISSNIYNIFFFNNLTKKFNLLGDPNLSYFGEQEFKAVRIRVYIAALSSFIKAYRGSLNVPPLHITSGLWNLNELLMNLCLKIRNQESLEINTSYGLREEVEGVRIITDFLAKLETIKDKATNNDRMSFQDKTVNSYLAQSISRAVESLAYMKNSTHIYYLVLNLFNGIDLRSENSVGYLAEFENYMWETIAKNVLKGQYPTTLKIYLIYFGMLLVPNCLRSNKWMEDQSERLRKALYVDLKPLLDKDTTMVNGAQMKATLLPENIVYADGNFIYIDNFGKRITIKSPTNFQTAFIA